MYLKSFKKGDADGILSFIDVTCQTLVSPYAKIKTETGHD